jgi:hypothetical protein
MWSTFRRLTGYLLGEASYWLCEWLDGFANRATTNTKLSAASAISAYQMLDLEGALQDTTLPTHVQATLGTFRPEEWEEVLAIAATEMRLLERSIEDTRWKELRRRA